MTNEDTVAVAVHSEQQIYYGTSPPSLTNHEINGLRGSHGATVFGVDRQKPAPSRLPMCLY